MKLLKLLGASALMLVVYSSPALAEYSFQLLLPPDAEDARLTGINNSGTVVGWVANEFGFDYSFEYDLKKGVYTAIIDDFIVMGISETGMMVGNPAYNWNLCAIRDKHGGITVFYPPSWNETSVCDARGVNADGKVSGFVIDNFGFGMWTGFIFDSEYGTYEEFLHSWGVIPQGINAQGQSVGSIGLASDEAYPGSPEGVYAYLREADGSIKYFAIGQSFPGESRARGISENGLISGFYLDPETFEYKSYVTATPEGSGFEYLWLTDDEFLHLSPCDPNAPPPPPPPEAVGGTDVLSFKIRNDGVFVGQCVDWQYDWMNDVFTVFGVYGLIGTPVK